MWEFQLCLAKMVAFLILLSLTCVSVLSQRQPRVKAIDGDLDISKINKDLQLFEGDIMKPVTKTRKRRSTYTTNRTLWPLPIKYKLDWLLEMNAKGVILDAFEQLRLKTCIDFTPKKFWFEPHIELEWNIGCWSAVGRQSTLKQVVSIGPNCDTMATVEHELLHALGFWHEQSRYDRDNYVTINWGNIEAGKEINFEIGTNDTNSSMGTPYDYLSIMHYSKDAFAEGNESTIITKMPEFQDIIGQRLDMSHYDVEELNRIYGCNDSISFLDHCSFDEGMCEMSSVEWQRVRQADGGPQSDHSHLGTNSKGSFMHFSTRRGRVGDSAILQTKIMTPRRSCKIQCLQFFYYHSGGSSDQLNIWIREFHSVNDTEGTRRFMGQIEESPANYWQLHHVPLDASKPFLVEFEARKRSRSSLGGFSVDDINLSETECPHQTWQIRDFQNKLTTSPNDTHLSSPKYYSPDGYRYQLVVQLNRDYFGVFVRLVSGDNDDRLQWPCPWRQMTFTLLDQNPHIQSRMSQHRSITTSTALAQINFFGKPSIFGSPDYTYRFYGYRWSSSYSNDGRGYGLFMSAAQLKTREFLKGGDIFFLITMKDISSLKFQDTLPCPRVTAKIWREDPTTTPSSSTTKTTTTVKPDNFQPPYWPERTPSDTSDSVTLSTPVIYIIAVVVALLCGMCKACCSEKDESAQVPV